VHIGGAEEKVDIPCRIALWQILRKVERTWQRSHCRGLYAPLGSHVGLKVFDDVTENKLFKLLVYLSTSDAVSATALLLLSTASRVVLGSARYRTRLPSGDEFGVG
jgi:hypothetical protein